VVRKDSWNDFNLKFAEICFVPGHRICPGKCSYAHEKNVYYTALGWNVLYMTFKSFCFRICFGSVPIFPFWFSVCMIYVLIVLKSPINVLFISPFKSVRILLIMVLWCWRYMYLWSFSLLDVFVFLSLYNDFFITC